MDQHSFSSTWLFSNLFWTIKSKHQINFKRPWLVLFPWCVSFKSCKTASEHFHKSLYFLWRFILCLFETVMCVYFCLSDSYLNNPNPFFFVFFSGSSSSSFFLLFFSFFFLVFFFFTFFSSSRSCREELLAGVSLPESSSESSVDEEQRPRREQTPNEI